MQAFSVLFTQSEGESISVSRGEGLETILIKNEQIFHITVTMRKKQENVLLCYCFRESHCFNKLEPLSEDAHLNEASWVFFVCFLLLLLLLPACEGLSVWRWSIKIRAYFRRLALDEGGILSQGRIQLVLMTGGSGWRILGIFQWTRQQWLFLDSVQISNVSPGLHLEEKPTQKLAEARI